MLMLWAMSRVYYCDSTGDSTPHHNVFSHSELLRKYPPTQTYTACKQRPITRNLSGLNTASRGELLQVYTL